MEPAQKLEYCQGTKTERDPKTQTVRAWATAATELQACLLVPTQEKRWVYAFAWDGHPFKLIRFVCFPIAMANIFILNCSIMLKGNFTHASVDTSLYEGWGAWHIYIATSPAHQIKLMLSVLAALAHASAPAIEI